MQTWSLFADKDGYGIHVVEVPLTAYLVDVTGEFILGSVLRHRLCCNLPGWTYRLPLGRPVYDRTPDMLDGNGKPWIENSLGSWIWEKVNAAQNYGWKREKDVMKFRVSQDEARTIDPDFLYADEVE